jgi:hypothetical protein
MHSRYWYIVLQPLGPQKWSRINVRFALSTIHILQTVTQSSSTPQRPNRSNSGGRYSEASSVKDVARAWKLGSMSSFRAVSTSPHNVGEYVAENTVSGTH